MRTEVDGTVGDEKEERRERYGRIRKKEVRKSKRGEKRHRERGWNRHSSLTFTAFINLLFMRICIRPIL